VRADRSVGSTGGAAISKFVIFNPTDQRRQSHIAAGDAAPASNILQAGRQCLSLVQAERSGAIRETILSFKVIDSDKAPLNQYYGILKLDIGGSLIRFNHEGWPDCGTP
jgi:hypothetical protein